MTVIYGNVAVIETADPARLDALIASGLDRFVVARLGPAAVWVDHERLPAIRRLLERLGEMPRQVAGG